MARTLSIAALLALSGTVAACSPSGGDVASASNRSLYSVNQPVVQRTDYVLDLSAPGGRLPTSEQARLADWFETLGLSYGDHVWVEEAYGPTPSRDDVANLVGDYGLFLDESAPATSGQVQPGSVRVIVGRSVATVPGCPNWDTSWRSGPTPTSTNYGCATNSNLAAMIADPVDLVLGKPGSGTDPKDAAKPVKVYRDKPATVGAVKSESTGGK
ncbi:CpaD family pilus assembly protein [Sphingosinicella rhizophila]|uniref:CpaD family pilus assembly lipoprotein n=1 Tax=Sphingosinicella rhizophila TaxID=3050082 RepID=A0ABU3Q4W4_9SPHN|nr:CpaD family pilus assembly lipoprotein [Sphingosinicella sp. GR2756]MDT9598456.1 CpaD family pilus assembly lipoprotein [Sphingosinicella sp. GR2756]